MVDSWKMEEDSILKEVGVEDPPHLGSNFPTDTDDLFEYGDINSVDIKRKLFLIVHVVEWVLQS